MLSNKKQVALKDRDFILVKKQIKNSADMKTFCCKFRPRPKKSNYFANEFWNYFTASLVQTPTLSSSLSSSLSLTSLSSLALPSLCIVLWLILIHNELIYVKARTEGPGLSRALLSISEISALGSNYRNADYR